jgi:hypothetical protein
MSKVSQINVTGDVRDEVVGRGRLEFYPRCALLAKTSLTAPIGDFAPQYVSPKVFGTRRSDLGRCAELGMPTRLELWEIPATWTD